MRFRDFLRRWRQGVRDVSPLQQVKAKRLGMVGQLIGVLVGLVWLLSQGLWHWVLVMFFTFVVLCVELLGVHQQVLELEEFE